MRNGNDLAKRGRGRVQITTDALKTYLNVIEDAFGGNCDYAMLHKIYGAPTDEETRRYSPAKCIGCEIKEINGGPDPKRVSTSYVERQNWTVRTNMRRYTRLSNGFSRKLANHAATVALNYFAYNFIKIHRTLRISPAMAAGVTDRLWSVEGPGSSLGSLRTAGGGKSGMTIDPRTNAAVEGKNTCECGLVWFLTEHKTPGRDQDDIRCTCGAILAKWNGGCYWTAELVEDNSK